MSHINALTRSEAGGGHRTGRPPARPRALIGAMAGAFLIVMPSLAFARPAPDSFADLAEKVSPAVVNISTEQEVTPQLSQNREGIPFPEGSPFGEFFKRFFENQQPGFPGIPMLPNRPQTMRALGSGFLIDADGHIVTNNHVIDGADKIEVTLTTGKTLSAKVVGRDARTDLALLKVESDQDLPHVSFGDSDSVRVGDWVLAVGNPFGLGGTVTAGIVSARGRHLDGDSIVDFLQTDASINRGNSGGPTFNRDGEVVGVNTAIYSPNGGSVGLGFAIPSNVAKKVIDDLREHGSVDRGWLGVQIQPVTPDIAESLGLEKAGGALVASVVPDSPAAKAGFKSGDVILSWNGTEVTKPMDLVRLVAGADSGEKAETVVWRDNDRKTMSVVTAEAPEKQADASEGGQTPGGGKTLADLGVGLADLTPDIRRQFGIPDHVNGVAVVRVENGSPAAEQGIRPGDVIQSVALSPVTDAKELAAKIKETQSAGKEVVMFKLSRQGQERFVAIRTGQA